MFFLFKCCWSAEDEPETAESLHKESLPRLRPNAENQIVSQAATELKAYQQQNPKMKFAMYFCDALQRNNYANIIEQLRIAQDNAISVTKINKMSRRQNPNSVDCLNIFQLLAQNGCWNALLISIVTGHCDPIQNNIFKFLVEGENKEFETKLQTEWIKLMNAPRSAGVRDNQGNERDNLEKVLSNPAIAELGFAYLAYRFLQEEHRFIDKDTGRPLSTNNKSFYAHCINHLLQNCWDKPQPTLLQLLCLCDVDIVMILTPETRNKIREQMRMHYQAGEEFICGAEVVNEVSSETRLAIRAAI